MDKTRGRGHTVINVHVGPLVESQTDHARAFPRDARPDEPGNHDRPWVLDAEVNKRAGGETVDVGGKHDVCACVSCMHAREW